MFEDQREVLRRYAEAGIRVNKVQISSALDVDVRTIGVAAAIEHLRAFAEPRYLHQTGFMTTTASSS
jgi:predicted regulator of amino acid metabolism with ACT domain